MLAGIYARILFYKSYSNYIYTCAGFKPSVLSESIDGSESKSVKICTADVCAFEASGANELAWPIAIAPKTTAENTLKKVSS